MAYSFVGFIGPLEPIQAVCTRFIFARSVSVGQEIFIIPLTEELQEQINDRERTVVEGFEFLTDAIESVAISASVLGPIGYAEVTYWAGEGSEAGIIWQERARVRTIRYGKAVINNILRYLGCIATEGSDEFSTMGFGYRRFTDDWLQS
jgi:hypothetical protein